MEEIISKKEFNELMNIKGEIRGAAIKVVAEFILKEEGEEGLKKLEKVMISLGQPMKYKDIKTLDFYPLGMEATLLLAAKRLFGYDDKKFQEMGEFAPKTSVILIRMFMKYLVSLKTIIKQAPRIWRQHYTTGDLNLIELNEEKRYIIARLENFHYVPMACHVYKGYFISTIQMVIRKTVTCEETKCLHRGDDYHEFLIKW